MKNIISLMEDNSDQPPSVSKVTPFSDSEPPGRDSRSTYNFYVGVSSRNGQLMDRGRSLLFFNSFMDSLNRDLLDAHSKGEIIC